MLFATFEHVVEVHNELFYQGQNLQLLGKLC